MDDGYAIGPSEIIFHAIEKFAMDVRQQCLLVWEKSKTEVFTWNGILPQNATNGLTRAGIEVNGIFEPGFMCYGVPIGTDVYVEHMLEMKMREISKIAETTCEVLESERQSLWTLLRLSLSQQLDYWLQLCYPSNVRAAANKMDDVLWKVLETTAFSRIPRNDSDSPWENVTKIVIPGLQEQSFQEWVVRQPIKLGGFGLRSQVDLSLAAYIGAVEQVIPSFTGVNGICPQIAHLVGSTEDPQSRWNTLLNSGCRTGAELASAWQLLQTEAMCMSDFLGINLESPLAVEAEAIGEGSTDGSTRQKIVEQREQIRGSVLNKVLETYPDQSARPVWVWPQRDKLSSAWLLSLPGPHNGLTSVIFSEAVCMNLCLPSPVCQDRLGESVGRVKVDLYGDNIMATNLPGDTWRIRHDTIKTEWNRLFMWANMRSTCEVFGLFSNLIPQEGLSRIERGRQRQGLVPDFMLEVKSPTGAKIDRLAELKVLNCCLSRYPVGERRKAVDRRSGLLQGEYRRKAREADRMYGGCAPDVAGPVERKLAQFGEIVGLVVGAFGEGSEDVHYLIQQLAETRASSMGIRRGREASDAEIGILVGQIRRSLSTTFVRAQVQCLLSRMNCFGKGVAQAAKRRQWAAKENERMARERQAQWLGRVRGTSLVRKGQFFVL